MKMTRKILVMLGTAFFTFSCAEKEFGATSDIDLPIPEITSCPESTDVGEIITIQGVNFIAPNTVMLGDTPATIVSETEKSIQVQMPRIFTKNYITVRNAHLRSGESASQIAPNYPDASEVVITWPNSIARGSKVVIEGQNVDMICEVDFLGIIYTIDGNQHSPDAISFNIPTDFPEAEVELQVKTIFNTILVSPMIPIVDFEGVYLITDFEDGNLMVTLGDATTHVTTVQDHRTGITAPQGSKFLSVYAENAGFWDYVGHLHCTFTYPVNLAVFDDPYLSFRYNSADGVGNISPSFIMLNEDGVACERAFDFSPAITGNPEDDQMIHPTNGEWEWISVPMSASVFTGKWAGPADYVFDPSGIAIAFKMMFKPLKSYNWNGVNTKQRINVDEICITEGKMQ